MKINISKVKNYSFEGTILDEHLSQKYLEYFEVDPNRDYTDEIKVDGEFTIEWDDDIPNVIVENLTFDNGNKYIEVDLDEVSTQDLEDQIQEYDNGSWAEDKIASQSDYAYERSRDD